MMSSSLISQGFIREEFLRSHLDEIIRAEDILMDVARSAGFAEERIPLFIVAVTEAISNAILHGNRQEAAKQVQLRFVWNPEDHLLTVEVRDEGEGFDPSNLPDPTESENLLRETGRGIFLMRNLADEVIFKERGRCVELRFRP
ncbi:MAG: ATP-binding protein [Bacteroidia bacterium]|nr:ATP-binding protein [Bacteroidia bacterium]MDW8014552.1 ATP-binding protein [Bacteroidia bacterium]